MKLLISFFTFTILSCLNPVNLQDDCEHLKTQNGIKVYGCELPNSNFNAVKAEFEINATLVQYATMALRVDRYPLWNFEARNSKLVEKFKSTELIYYSEVDAPWPVQDRDIILHMKVDQHPISKILTIQLKSLPDYLPENPEFIRIKEYWSELRVIPLSLTKSRIEYYLELNPGGEIPAWIVNFICARIPINTFTNFKNSINSFTNTESVYYPIMNWGVENY